MMWTLYDLLANRESGKTSVRVGTNDVPAPKGELGSITAQHLFFLLESVGNPSKSKYMRM